MKFKFWFIKVSISVVIFFLFHPFVFSQYTINSVFGSLEDCDTVTSGIYIVWWDNDWDYHEDAELLLEQMEDYRDVCLNELDMQDPPNPTDGYFYNVYLHHSGDIFPGGWGNGQGTDSNGYPYLTLPIGAHLDWVNVAHETFHVFQYSGNSPGFSYSGDSQWYIEAAANWFAAIQNMGHDNAFLEAESLVHLPHVALWLSYDNFPNDYPQNWQRYVHQYALALLLYYLSEQTDVPDNLITDGLYAGTDELPQEYFFNQIGAAVFRNHFIDWAAHMTNHFDFLPENQIARFETEWNNYADPADDNEFIQVFLDDGSPGWFRPNDTLVTKAWSFNTYKLINQSDGDYTFELKGDDNASNGDSSFFQGKILVQNAVDGASFHDLEMTTDQEGELVMNFSQNDTTIYFIVASMPEVFTDINQIFPYEIRITKGDITGLDDLQAKKPDRKVINRFDLLGHPVNESFEGIQIVVYDDGSVKKIYKLNNH